MFQQKLARVLDAETAGLMVSKLKSSNVPHLCIQHYLIQKCAVSILMQGLEQTNISRLILSQNEFQEDAFQVLCNSLKNCSKLKALHVDMDIRCVLSSEDVIKLAIEMVNTNITELFLYNGKLGKAGLKVLARILKTSKVERLGLPFNEFGDSDIKVLVKGLKCSNVTSLDLRFNKITDEGMGYLAEYIKKEKLEYINLWSSKATEKGTKDLFLALKNSNLKTLKFQGHCLGYLFLTKYLTNSLAKTSLSCIRLSMDSEALATFSESLKNTKLLKVAITLIDMLKKHNLKLFSENLIYSEITHLKFTNCRLDLPGISSFVKALKNSDVTHLSLEMVNWVLDDIHCLLQCLPQTKIESLTLHNFRSINCEFDIPLETFPSLNRTCITHLDLRQQLIGEKGIIELTEGLKGSKVESLFLIGNLLGDPEVTILANGFKDMHLRKLVLKNNNITEEGCEAIGKNLKYSQISFLDLNENPIECDGLKLLTSCIKDTLLISLNFSNRENLYLGIESCQDIDKNLRDSQLTHLSTGFFNLGQYTHSNLKSSFKIFKENYSTGDLNSIACRMTDHYDEIRDTLFDNWIAAEHITYIFKIVCHKDCNGLTFSLSKSGLKFNEYVEYCLTLTSVLNKTPGMASHIMQDSVNSTLEDIRQFIQNMSLSFCLSIVENEDISISQRVDVLVQADSKDENVARDFLMHRPAFLVDEQLGILHPTFYQMLYKYNMVLYYPSIEPDKKAVIIDYFSTNTEHFGAKEVIDLLNKIP